MQFANLLEESRLTAKPSHTGIHGYQNIKKKIKVFLPSPVSWRFRDAEMHKYVVITQQPHT